MNRPLNLFLSSASLIRGGGGGGSTARLQLGGRELTLLYGFNQYTLLQNRDNSGLLGTPLYCSLKLGGGGGHRPPPCPPCGAPLLIIGV